MTRKVLPFSKSLKEKKKELFGFTFSQNMFGKRWYPGHHRDGLVFIFYCASHLVHKVKEGMHHLFACILLLVWGDQLMSPLPIHSCGTRLSSGLRALKTLMLCWLLWTRGQFSSKRRKHKLFNLWIVWHTLQLVTWLSFASQISADFPFMWQTSL